ncbi:MAG TPA: type II methionyl aminopeptidase [Candidatus Omnitrophota bacterium]|nr:type II methionyl aminopeptidase [Candidatus Omnitrophota bacterium]
MTEKNYGGAAPFRKEGKSSKSTDSANPMNNKSIKIEKEMTEEEIDKAKVLKAGKITSEVREYARSIAKKDVPLLEIAEKIEKRIVELGGKPAFPTNLSINDVAAHYTPSHDDKTKANGLLKVDFGVHVDGWVADNAFSVDLDGNSENKKLIEASEKALNNALELIKKRGDNNLRLNEIGKEIQKTIESYKATPIINLSGHSISHYDLHAGITIPNYDNESTEILEEGICAIEPFATFGNGKVRDGKPSGIYSLIDERNARSPIARKILDYIIENYSTLPFCSRWIVKKFGQGALFGLKQLEDNGNLHQFSQLLEVSGRNVSQAEHTILIEKNKVEITTK